MYSIVLATMLTASAASPDWCGGCGGCGGCRGCHSCWSCSGCGGCNAFSCGGCGGCYGCGGCWGCGGCYGCGGCGSCYWGSSYISCASCGTSCWGCYGCGGCGVVYVAPATPEKIKKPQEGKKDGTALPNHATIVVAVANDAKVTVDGDPVTLNSTPQSFRTPALEPDREYYYTFKAEVVRNGQKVTESKRVTFRAGETARVEFNNLGAPAAVAAK